ncbi:NUDIX hydrolase [Lactobacillus agrestimuris]|uniref:NUDIX hydrolase n=1 Tax=Lactobacillus agrestimuris TaxID=2941328 RepID=UPI002042CA75|nr:NUDIX hydrolase [Lactobacillus agrestimuris]
MSDYIKDIRKKVGHDPLILTFASGILTNDDNLILLQKRSDFKTWGLPGGAIEFGETAEDACVREFLEETGMKVRVKSLLGVSSNQIQNYPNGDIAQSILIIFLVELIKEVTDNLSSETLELKYFNKNNLPKIFNDQHRKSIKNFFDNKIPFYD